MYSLKWLQCDLVGGCLVMHMCSDLCAKNLLQQSTAVGKKLMVNIKACWIRPRAHLDQLFAFNSSQSDASRKHVKSTWKHWQFSKPPEFTAIFLLMFLCS